MLTNTLNWQASAGLDSPWRRLPWTLPSALLICALAFIWFAYSMEQPAQRQPEPAPVQAELIELPAPAETIKSAAPPTPSVAPPPKLVAPTRDTLPAEPPPVTRVAPPAVDTPPTAAPALPAAPVVKSQPAESHGAQAVNRDVSGIPDELRESAMSESGVARFQINADGSFTVELVKPTQNPRLNRWLLSKLKQWKFSPALQDGKPVASVEEKVIRVNVQ